MDKRSDLIDLANAKCGRALSADQISLIDRVAAERMAAAMADLVGRAVAGRASPGDAPSFAFEAREDGRLFAEVSLGSSIATVEFAKDEWQEVIPSRAPPPAAPIEELGDWQGAVEQAAAMERARDAGRRSMTGAVIILDRSEASMSALDSVIGPESEGRPSANAWLQGHSPFLVLLMVPAPGRWMVGEIQDGAHFTAGALEEFAGAFADIRTTGIRVRTLADQALAQEILQRWRALGGLAEG